MRPLIYFFRVNINIAGTNPVFGTLFHHIIQVRFCYQTGLLICSRGYKPDYKFSSQMSDHRSELFFSTSPTF